MKHWLINLLLVCQLCAGGIPELAGVWIADDARLRCMCGHETQLVLVQVGKSEEYTVEEYCLDHNSVAVLGALKRTEKELKLGDLAKKLKFTLSDDGTKLSLVGDTVLGEEALVFRRADAKKFREALAKIPASQLILSRESLFFSTYDAAGEGSDDPFAED